MEQRKRKLTATLLAAAASAALAVPAHAITYTESPGDAGQTLTTAQGTTTAAGPAGTALTGISGNISNILDADVYAFRITSNTAFSATTVGGSALDTALFLFDASGSPIATNDDAAGGTSIQSTLAQGNSLYATLSPGIYFLGISLSGNEAINSAGQRLFAAYPGGDTTATRGAAPGLNPTTLANYDGFSQDTFETTTAYSITLTGAATAANPFAVPEPSTWAAMALGTAATGLVLLRRRQQQA